MSMKKRESERSMKKRKAQRLIRPRRARRDADDEAVDGQDGEASQDEGDEPGIEAPLGRVARDDGLDDPLHRRAVGGSARPELGEAEDPAVGGVEGE
jgi:hypothetical protein